LLTDDNRSDFAHHARDKPRRFIEGHVIGCDGGRRFWFTIHPARILAPEEEASQSARLLSGRGILSLTG